MLATTNLYQIYSFLYSFVNDNPAHFIELTIGLTVIIFTIVDFPAPFGPNSPWTELFSMLIDIRFTAISPLKFFVNPVAFKNDNFNFLKAAVS